MSDAPLPEITNEPVLDIQHDTDPAHEEPPARRIPHLGHTLVFFSLVSFSVFLCLGIALLAVHASANEPATKHPFAAAFAQVAGYAITVAISVPLFPIFWTYSFWQGIHWNLRAARINWWKLLILGVSCSLLAQFADRFVTTPDSSDLLELFRTPLSAWITALVGSVVPAFMEELAFRGFLLPSLATAYDWLALDRTPAAVDRWHQTNSHTRTGWIFATVFSSLAFALLHAGQIHGAKGSLIILFFVSVVFSLVRIRTRSVAAATLVHITYDALIFAEMCVETGAFRHLDKLQ